MSQPLVPALRFALQIARDNWMQSPLFPFVAGEQLFSRRLADQAAEAIGCIPWRRVETDFYTQWENRLDRIGKLPEPFAEIASAFNDPSVTDLVATLVPDGASVSVASLVLHRLMDGDRIEVHNDCNDFGECFRLCWIFGQRTFAGGHFQTHHPIPPWTIDADLAPIQDAWHCFAIGPKSYHSVTPITGDGNGRLSLIVTWKIE